MRICLRMRVPVAVAGASARTRHVSSQDIERPRAPIAPRAARYLRGHAAPRSGFSLLGAEPGPTTGHTNVADIERQPGDARSGGDAHGTSQCIRIPGPRNGNLSEWAAR